MSKPPSARFLFPLLAAALAALAVMACGGDDSDPEPPATVAASQTAPATDEAVAAANTGTPAGEAGFVFTDDSGEEIRVASPPGRIISYSPAITEILFAIGAGDRLVATDEFSNYPPEAQELPKLDYSDPAPEPALTLEPDLVFMVTNQEGQVEQFRGLGLTIVLLREPEDLQGVIDEIRLIGRIAGRIEQAEELAAGMEERIAAVGAAVAEVDEGPVVFFELTPDGYTVGPDSFVGAMLSLVKARNAAEGIDNPFPQLNQEAIIAADPDVILLADAGDYGGQTAELVAGRPGWQGITAVVEGRVHEIDSDVYTRPGPRIIEALEELVELLYPEG